VLRLPILVALILVTTMPVSAQDPTPVGGINPVQAALAADAVRVGCDDIGFSVLVEELHANTVDVDHHGACHAGVDALLFASCHRPFGYGDPVAWANGPALGELQILCYVGVISVSEADMVVDPADFFLIDENNREVGFAPGLQAEIPEERRFNRGTLEAKGTAEGNLLFSVEEPLATPFLFGWEPPTRADPPFVVIVIDRFEAL
jgi:hypothetical protein